MSEMSLLQRLEFLTEKARRAIYTIRKHFNILFVILNLLLPVNFPLFYHFLLKKYLHLKNNV